MHARGIVGEETAGQNQLVEAVIEAVHVVGMLHRCKCRSQWEPRRDLGDHGVDIAGHDDRRCCGRSGRLFLTRQIGLAVPVELADLLDRERLAGSPEAGEDIVRRLCQRPSNPSSVRGTGPYRPTWPSRKYSSCR